jgi:hypothetical protein
MNPLDLVEMVFASEDDLDVIQSEGEVIPFYKSTGEDDVEIGGQNLKSEQPWHRTLGHLLLQGYSNKDAAELLGKNPATISLVKRQPWFRSLLAAIAQRSFKGDFLGLLEGSAINAITTLETLSSTAKNESVRASASGKLLDAFLKHSKPREEDKKPLDPQQRALELDRQLEEAERELGNRAAIEVPDEVIS